MKLFLKSFLVLAICVCCIGPVIAQENGTETSSTEAAPATQSAPAAEKGASLHTVQAYQSWVESVIEIYKSEFQGFAKPLKLYFYLASVFTGTYDVSIGAYNDIKEFIRNYYANHSVNTETSTQS